MPERRDGALLPGARLQGKQHCRRDEDDEPEREADRVQPQIELSAKTQRTKVQLLRGPNSHPEHQQRHHRRPGSGAGKSTPWFSAK